MLLALVMCLGMLSVTALAASDDGHFFMVVGDEDPAIRVSADEELAAAGGDIAPRLGITGIDVELVRSIHDVPGCVDRSRISSVNYPDADGYVHIPEGGFISTVDGEYKPYDVIVLYKITVTGDVGAAYRVTDPGAVYVGGEPMSGVVPEDGDAVLYVTRDFMNIQVGDDGHIRNTATVTSGKGEESNSSSTEATPVVMGKTRMLSFGVNMNFSCLETGEDGVLHESMSLSDIPTAFELSYEYTDTDGIEHAGTWTYDDATVFLEKINGTDRSVPALTWPILSIKIEDGESIPIKFRQSGYVIDGDTGKFVYKSTTVRDIVTRGSSATHSTRWWFTDNYKLSNVTWKEMPQKLRLSYMYLKSVDEVRCLRKRCLTGFTIMMFPILR